MSADKRDADRLLGGLVGPVGPELSCDACFEQLDAYVDLHLAGEEADRRLPGMRAHLEGCPACDEDHKSLVAFLVNVDRRR